MQVGNQSAEGLIQQRQVVAGVAEIVAVIIPEAVGHGDETGSGLDQSASDQELLIEHGGCIAMHLGIAFAVAFPDGGGLFLDIQRLKQTTRGQHAEGLLIEPVHPSHETTGIHLATETVERGEQGPTISQAIGGDAIEHHVGLGVSRRAKSIMRYPGIARIGGIVRPVLHPRFHTHEGRDRVIGRT